MNLTKLLVFALCAFMLFAGCAPAEPAAAPAGYTPAPPAVTPTLATPAPAPATPAPMPTPVPTPAPVQVTYDIGVSVHSFDDVFIARCRQELESYFAARETDTAKYNVVIVDGKDDADEQAAQADAFIEQGVDVLIMNLVDAASAAAISQRANDAGTPVVYIGRQPSGDDMADFDSVCFIGADAKQAGVYQGEIIASLPDRGDADGDGVVRYVMLTGDPESENAQYRTLGSIEAMTAAGIEAERLFEESAGWDRDRAQELATAALEEFGEEIDVIICNSDDMALGALQAIRDNGRAVGENIYLVGADALDEAVALVESGAMTGTVLNDHIAQSRKAVEAAIQYIEGGRVDKYAWFDYQKVV